MRFEVKIELVDPGDFGADAVCFLFSANPGQPMAPLVEVASGGEMSRFLLALKTSLAKVDGSSTLLFDEIDTGVSGRVSGAMADRCAPCHATVRCLCVTHQPLVAAVADHHFRVSKDVSAGITRSRVSHLRDTQERQRELAELAGGDREEASGLCGQPSGSERGRGTSDLRRISSPIRSMKWGDKLLVPRLSLDVPLSIRSVVE